MKKKKEKYINSMKRGRLGREAGKGGYLNELLNLRECLRLNLGTDADELRRGTRQRLERTLRDNVRARVGVRIKWKGTLRV